MKKIIKFLIIISILIGLSPIVNAAMMINHSEEKNEQSAINAEWTALYYLCGDNKLSAVQQQMLSQIQSVGSSSEVQIAILIDKNQDGDTKLYYLNGNELLEQEWQEESAMDDPTTLEQFILKVKNDLLSSKYFLQLSSNKGSGWQGVCYDQIGDGTMITMTELSTVLSEVTNQGSQKIDVMAIETCLGGNLELAYQIKNFCSYYVGYADCGVGGSWPFQESISTLVANPSMSPASFASAIVDSFTPEDIPQWKLMTAVGAIDLQSVDAVEIAIDNLGQYFIDNLEVYQSDILSALEDIRIYGEMWDIDYYIDLVQFLNKLEFKDQEGQNIKNQILSSVSSLVINKKHLEKDDCEGFNFYFPRRSSDFNLALRYDNGILPDTYEKTLFSIETSWDDFLKIFLGIANNQPPNKPTIIGPQEGKAGEQYDYLISSTDQDNDRLYYYIDWGDESNSDWLGPYDSGDEITFSHIWENQESYTIKVKARDEKSAESDFNTLTISMKKSKCISSDIVNTILIGKISDIERDQNQGFRFLPIHLLIIIFGGESEFSISMLDETNGGYPCCCYIAQDKFSGYISPTFIIGIWKI
jgi:hypothetical protein